MSAIPPTPTGIQQPTFSESRPALRSSLYEISPLIGVEEGNDARCAEVASGGLAGEFLLSCPRSP